MNVKQNLSVLFCLKRQKITKDGRIPIYIRITIDGFEDQISLGCKILPCDWDNTTKTVRATEPNSKIINKKIGQAKTDIERHFDLMQAKHGAATPRNVKASYMTRVNGYDLRSQRVENLALSESIDEAINACIAYQDKVNNAHKDGRQPTLEKQELLTRQKEQLKKLIETVAKKAATIFDDKDREKTFIMGVDEYLLHFLQMVFTGHRSCNTLEKMIGRKRRYLDFLAYKYKMADIGLEQMEYKFLGELLTYLFIQHEVTENTAMKYVQCVKEIVDRTVSNGWLPANIFAIFQCKYTDPQHDWLTMDELNRLKNFRFEKEKLNIIRDIFLFSSFTGLSYQEVFTLKPADIITGIDGKKWVNKNRQKTDSDETLPLLPIPLQILDKYKNYPICIRKGRLLPVPTNQEYNRCLKEIGTINKFRVLLKTHKTRYFFANEVTYNNGVPLKTVSKMLGHKSVKTTEIYVRANRKNISEQMEMVEKKLFDANGRFQAGMVADKESINSSDQFPGNDDVNHPVKVIPMRKF